MVFDGESVEVKIFDNSKWLKVFYHDCTGQNFFESEEQALYSTDPKKYSILANISSKHKINHKYEFIIFWPSLQQYHRWRQVKNPIYDIEQNIGLYQVEGFETIYPKEIPEADQRFGGLVKTAISDGEYNNSLLNGIPGTNWWYYSIGMYTKSKQYYKDNGIPAVIPNLTNIVSLWLLIQKQGTCNIIKTPIIPPYFFYFCLIP